MRWGDAPQRIRFRSSPVAGPTWWRLRRSGAHARLLTLAWWVAAAGCTGAPFSSAAPDGGVTDAAAAPTVVGGATCDGPVVRVDDTLVFRLGFPAVDAGMRRRCSGLQDSTVFYRVETPAPGTLSYLVVGDGTTAAAVGSADYCSWLAPCDAQGSVLVDGTAVALRVAGTRDRPPVVALTFTPLAATDACASPTPIDLSTSEVTVQGTFADAADLQQFTCAGGRERVYSFALAEASDVRVRALEGDLAGLVLHEGGCPDAVTWCSTPHPPPRLMRSLPAGNHTLVVESGRDGPVGGFAFGVRREPTRSVPNDHCQGAVAVDLSTGEAEVTTSFAGAIPGPNSPVQRALYFAVTLPWAGRLSATTTVGALPPGDSGVRYYDGACAGSVPSTTGCSRNLRPGRYVVGVFEAREPSPAQVTLRLHATRVVPPENETCQSAIPLLFDENDTVTLQEQSLGLTEDMALPEDCTAGSGLSDDVFYRLDLAELSDVSVHAESAYHLLNVGILADGCDSPRLVACNGGGSWARLPAGTYHVVVEPESRYSEYMCGGETGFTLQAARYAVPPAPANATCEAAMPLTVGETTGAAFLRGDARGARVDIPLACELALTSSPGVAVHYRLNLQTAGYLRVTPTMRPAGSVALFPDSCAAAGPIECLRPEAPVVTRKPLPAGRYRLVVSIPYSAGADTHYAYAVEWVPP